MAIDSRHSLARAASMRYLKSGKAEKTQILDEFCANTGISRKHAVRLLRRPPQARTKRNRLRRRTYGELESEALRRLWPLCGYLSALRTVAALSGVLEALERHSEWLPEPKVKAKLLTMSASTCNRLLKPLRRHFPDKSCSGTKAGKYLKSQIAVRYGMDWDDAKPGFVEVDLVSHSGPIAEGTFLHTLTMVDVSTGWLELAVLKGKGSVEAARQIGLAGSKLPFGLKGIDSDNGSEFINYHLMKFCEDRKILLTRSRPYIKNDGCRVEQKNGAVVRKHIGHRRLESDAQAGSLQELYSVLRLLVNFFEPSAKLTRTKTQDGKMKKTYDLPKTPYQRCLESDQVDESVKQDLTRKFLTLNPVRLRSRLQGFKEDLIDEDMVRFLGDFTT